MAISKVFLQIGKMMIEGRNEPLVAEFTEKVKNISGNLSANLLWQVYNSVEYHKDVKEYWQSAKETLEKGGGDCEDSTILLGAAALRLGILVRYRVVSTNGKNWDHIYPLLYDTVNERWDAADATFRDNVRLGRECQHVAGVTFGVDGGVYELGAGVQRASFEWVFALGIMLLVIVGIVTR